MIRLTVLEPEAGRIADIIARKLRSLPEGSTARGLAFCHESDTISRRRPDMVVVSPLPGRRPRAPVMGGCGYLLVPGAASDLRGLPRPDCVISYGLSKKDCITFSSISEDKMVLSLQRELPTLTGGLLERQDIPMRRPAGRRSDELLASAAALLVLGLTAENLVI